MLDPAHPIAQLLEEDNRYSFEAYKFIFESLQYAQESLDMGAAVEADPESEAADAPERHVSGRDLCEAIRRYAIDQYGYMAKTVLNSWGLRCTGDFGEVVFNLIRIGQMRKTPSDARADFDDVYDFDVAFERDFKIAPN